MMSAMFCMLLLLAVPRAATHKLKLRPPQEKKLTTHSVGQGTNVASNGGGTFAVECEAKLRAANYWEGYQWEFADPLDDEVRVIWFHSQPHCFKHNKATRECIPFFEIDWLFNELLRYVPAQKSNLLTSSGGTTLSDSALYIFTNMFARQDVALATAKALGICGAKTALLHFGDESGSETLTYAPEWKYIMRQYYLEKTVKKYEDRIQVIPLGYTTHFWDNDKVGLRTHPERLKVGVDPKKVPHLCSSY
jgi:hypothetical protein